MREAAIQKAIVDYCRAVLSPRALVFAIPNASRRTQSGRAMNAVPGLMKGVSDLCVIAGGHVIWAEVKTARGMLSDDQAQFLFAVAQWPRNHGVVWRSIDDARATFAALCIETRETLAA